jgi:hypothetical protein
VLCSQLHHFGFDVIPSPQTAGNPFSVTIRAYDSGNNPYNYSGYARVYSSWDNPVNPQYCDTLVLFSSGVWTGNVPVYLAADTLSLICDDGGGHTGASNQIQVNANSPGRLLSLVPGQIYDPGTTSGRSGSAQSQVVGVYFSVEIRITDNWYNTVDTADHSIRYQSSDTYGATSMINIQNGVGTLSYAFRTAASQQRLYFHDQTNITVQSDTSSWIAVSPGPYGRLLVLFEGETHVPGDNAIDSPGKTGVPNDYYVDSLFPVLVYATDTCWNQTTENGGQIRLYSDFLFSNPPAQSLVDGETTFQISFSEIGRVILWAEDNNSTYDSYNNYLNILAVIDTSVATDSVLVYPNPMGIESNTMVFAYYLQGSANVTFEIYDPFGNLVLKRDWNAGTENAQAGMNHFVWNGRNDRNVRVASGIYYTIIKAWTHTATVFSRKIKVGVVW